MSHRRRHGLTERFRSDGRPAERRPMGGEKYRVSAAETRREARAKRKKKRVDEAWASSSTRWQPGRRRQPDLTPCRSGNGSAQAAISDQRHGLETGRPSPRRHPSFGLLCFGPGCRGNLRCHPPAAARADSVHLPARKPACASGRASCSDRGAYQRWVGRSSTSRIRISCRKPPGARSAATSSLAGEGFAPCAGGATTVRSGDAWARSCANAVAT